MKRTLNGHLSTIAQRLAPLYSAEHAQQVAQWLLEHVTGRPSTHLLTHATLDLTTEQEEQLQELLTKLLTEDAPLQYLLGTVPFGPLTLEVEPPILIPRPETEAWVQDLAQQLRTHGSPPLTILDLCTGSGCIALLLAHALPHATVYGIDINPQAIALAQRNAAHNGITNVTFMVSNLYSALPHALRFHLVVSNPPYIAADVWQTLEPQVRLWEDPIALVAKEQGMACIRAIAQEIPAHLAAEHMNNGLPQLVLEIGHDQGGATQQLLQEQGYTNISIIKDLAGHDRVVTAHWPTTSR